MHKKFKKIRSKNEKEKKKQLYEITKAKIVEKHAQKPK